ncbi:hypothetical protein GQ54DRAFT_188940 [Martensiomyces pterosporus]|nr:hypothetical protein GQ54DRAFT_188940 [Martensiomyces pterosporus]
MLLVANALAAWCSCIHMNRVCICWLVEGACAGKHPSHSDHSGKPIVRYTIPCRLSRAAAAALAGTCATCVHVFLHCVVICSVDADHHLGGLRARK